MNAQTLGQIGPFISGVSLGVAAIVPWLVYQNFQKRDLDQRWLDRFHYLYREFWADREMGKVRMWIVSDQLYAHNLQPELIARDAPHDAPNNLDEQQNKVLNSLDRFCSLISLAQSL